MVEPETHCYGRRQKQNKTTTRQLVNNRGIPKTQRVSGSTNKDEMSTSSKKRTKTVLVYSKKSRYGPKSENPDLIGGTASVCYLVTLCSFINTIDSGSEIYHQNYPPKTATNTKLNCSSIIIPWEINQRF